MNKFMFRGIPILILVGFAAPAYAVPATGSVSIIQPISISKDTDLQFGTVAKPATGTGTVAINATSGALTAGSGAAAVTSTTGRATFTVSGDASRAFTATIPADFTMTGPGANIIVTLTSSTIPGSLDGSGAAAFGVGGSFNLPAAQVTGNYTGNFDVTVAYN